MKTKVIPFLPLFKKFIADSKNGNRLMKNGKLLKPQTVSNYLYVLKALEEFSQQEQFTLRFRSAKTLNARERVVEQRYWHKFHKKFTGFLYSYKNCHDNYVGFMMKTLRVFFNYVNHHRQIDIGNYHQDFYVIKEQHQLIVLNTAQMRFLILDLEFRESLSESLRETLDMFILMHCSFAVF